MLRTHNRRLLAAHSIGGILVSSSFVAPVSAVAAVPAATCSGAPVSSSMLVSVVVHADKTATARVSVDDQVSDSGTITVEPLGYSEGLRFSDGTPEVKQIPASSGTQVVTVSLPSPDPCTLARSDETTYDPASVVTQGGIQGSTSSTGLVRGTDRSSRIAGAEISSRVTASPGALGAGRVDVGTGLLSLLGLGLVSAGTASVVVSRRRIRSI